MSDQKQKENAENIVQNKNNKLVPKVYRDSSSFFDSIYHAIKKDREDKVREKRKTQRNRLQAVKNVEISTPIKRLKRKCDLHFDISPISLKNSTIELPSIEMYEEPAQHGPKVTTPNVYESNKDKIVIQNENSMIVPEILAVEKEVSKFKAVHFNSALDENKASELDESKTVDKVNLRPGKWRHSLINWRKSHNPVKLIHRPSRRFVALFPIRTDPGILKEYKKKLQLSLEKCK